VVNARLTTDLTGETAHAGPWPDGPNNLADLGAGRHEFAGVPFEIQGLTILYSSPHAASKPKSVRVPVNASADGLVFLHACGWDAPGEVIARYVVRYADGRQKRVPVREGVHLTNWWSENRSLAGAQLAWRGRSEAHEPCCLYAMPWDNPWPDQTITEIEAESGGTQAFLILAGITLGRK
jgi:hypothetical protein